VVSDQVEDLLSSVDFLFELDKDRDLRLTEAEFAGSPFASAFHWLDMGDDQLRPGHGQRPQARAPRRRQRRIFSFTRGRRRQAAAGVQQWRDRGSSRPVASGRRSRSAGWTKRFTLHRRSATAASTGTRSRLYAFGPAH
jgi:hypothetical protein